jgi:hypothetical protein
LLCQLLHDQIMVLVLLAESSISPKSNGKAF